MSATTHDLLVVGAGIAGLSCAQAAAAAGMQVVVIEKSPGVGGRCATRRVDGQPVDHGLAFLHGSSAGFLEALDAVDATPLPGWPVRTRGAGTPCQPAAFSIGQRRLAFAEGVSAFAKHLALGLEVRRNARVVAAAVVDSAVGLRLADGQVLNGKRIALALPCEQTGDLLSSLGAEDPEIRAARLLLEMIGTRSCLTVLAGYPVDGSPPDWDIWYPEDSKVLQVLSHDSSKRKDPRYRVLVLQAHPRWSREQREVEPEVWSERLIEEAARLTGPGARNPVWRQAHRWRHARADGDGELSSPIVIELPGGALIGLAGEVFAPGGGAQAAFLSGRALARRLAGHGVT